MKQRIELSQGVKASAALFVASLVTKGIAYITTPIFTRLLTAEQYGQVTVFLTWQNVLGIIAMFCLMNGVFNNGMVDYPKERDNYSFSILGMSNLITVITGFVLLLLYPYVKHFVNLPDSFIFLMFALFLFQPAYNFWAARQRYEMKWKALMVWSIVIAVLSPLVAILCIWFLDADRLYSRIFGAQVPMIIIYIGFYVYLGYRNKFKIDTRFWKAAFLFNLPLIPHYLSNLLMTSADTLMIAKYVDFSSTAYYGVAFSISAVLAVLWESVNASLIPYTYEKCKVEDYNSISKVTMPLLWLFAIACFVLVLMGPEVVRIMATHDYMEAIYVIPPIIAGVFFQVQYYIYGNVVFYYKKPVFVMIGSVSATIINIILNYLFIPRFGYVAAAYTTLFAYIIQTFIDFFAMRHVVGKSIYDVKQILLLSGIIILGSILCVIIYYYAWIRYALLLFTILVLFVKRKKIIGLLKFGQ